MSRNRTLSFEQDEEAMMHHIERAMFDLRRGLPVVIRSDNHCLIVQATENSQSVEALASLAGSRPAMVMTQHRLAFLGVSLEAEAATLPLSAGVTTAELNALSSDRVTPDRLSLEGLLPATRAERSALILLRRALLVPAALCAEVHPDRQASIDAQLEQGELLHLHADQAASAMHAGAGMLKRVSEAAIPLQDATTSRFVLFREPDGMREHVAVVIGNVKPDQGPVPVRLHSACLTGDLFGSLRCDCGEQLRNAVSDIDGMGGGVLLYLAQEGRGIGLANKLRAYTLQDQGLDTLDADQVLGFGEDERHYGVAVDMLRALGIGQVGMLTNNPLKLAALRQGGIEVVSRQALYGSVNDHNQRYLSAKADRAGHYLHDVLDQAMPGD